MRTAEPLLYLAVFIGAIHIVFIDMRVDAASHNHFGLDAFTHSWLPEIGLGFFGWGWMFLMITSPLQVALAWVLIHYGTGRRRVFGMWNRLGGNIGICLGLSAFIISRILAYNLDPPDSPLFALIILTGVALYTGSLALRDILSLIALRVMTDAIYEYEVTNGQ